MLIRFVAHTWKRRKRLSLLAWSYAGDWIMCVMRWKSSATIVMFLLNKNMMKWRGLKWRSHKKARGQKRVVGKRKSLEWDIHLRGPYIYEGSFEEGQSCHKFSFKRWQHETSRGLVSQPPLDKVASEKKHGHDKVPTVSKASERACSNKGKNQFY